MRRASLAAALIALAACLPRGLIEVPSVGPEEFVPLASQKGTLLLDVRSFDEFDKGSIPGAVSFPAREIFERADEIYSYRERTVLIFGADRKQAAHAASELKRSGFKDVRTLDGGPEKWIAEEPKP